MHLLLTISGWTGTASNIDFNKELNVLHRLRHPNVVAFYGGVSNAGGDDSTPEHEIRRCIVLERCQGSVWQMLTTHGRPGPAESREPGTAKLNFPTRVRYALDAAKGMVFLHQHDIIHHDLKSSNLLVASDKLRTVKICDFSLSDLFSQSVASGDDHFHDEESGTLGWIAPEKMGSGLVTKKVDVYSFAMILWELLHAAKPFEDELFGDNVSDAMRKIRMVDLLKTEQRPDVDETLREWYAVSEQAWAEFVALMRACWRQEPADRPDFTAVRTELETLRQSLLAELSGGASPRPSAVQNIGVGTPRAKKLGRTLNSFLRGSS